MPYCCECTQDAEVTARCAGDDCRQGICPLCFEADGLCTPCRREQAKGIWQRPVCPPARTVALLLSGATIGGERVPRITEDNDHV